MEETKVKLEDGQEKLVNGIFYIYNSKYYFMYTEKELDENGYVIMHLVQVGKEAINTPEGTSSTGNMVGIEIMDDEEWKLVQASITKIVEDKKNSVLSPEIQYLSNDMLSDLRIASKKTFRLMKDIVVGAFGVNVDVPAEVVTPVEALAPMMTPEAAVAPVQVEVSAPAVDSMAAPISTAEPAFADQNLISATTPLDQNLAQPVEQPTMAPTAAEALMSMAPEVPANGVNPFVAPIPSPEPAALPSNETFLEDSNVIIDYRAKFFEEQEKNKALQREIDALNEKLNSIKLIVG